MYFWTCFNKLLRMFRILLAKYKETSGNTRLLHTIVYISFSGFFFFFCRFICFVGKYFWCGCTAWWAASCLSSLWVYCWVYKTWHFGSFFSCATTSRKAGLRNNRCWKKKTERKETIILFCLRKGVWKRHSVQNTHILAKLGFLPLHTADSFLTIIY